MGTFDANSMVLTSIDGVSVQEECTRRPESVLAVVRALTSAVGVGGNSPNANGCNENGRDNGEEFHSGEDVRD